MTLNQDAATLAEELRRWWQGDLRRQALRVALDRWQSVLDEAERFDWLEGPLRDAGLPVEAFALQVQRSRLESDPTLWAQTIGGILGSGDPWWATELLDQTGCATRELQRLRVEAALALGEAQDAISEWSRRFDDEAARDAAIGWWIRSGRVEQAVSLLESSPGNPLWRARLELWRNRPGAARAVLAAVPASPEASYLSAVADVLEGRLGAAEHALRGLLDDRSCGGEAGSWLAAALRKLGRYEEAVRAADAARISETGFSLATRLERELCTSLAAGEAGALPDRSLLGSILRACGLVRDPNDDPRVRRIYQLEHARTVCELGLESEDPLIRLADLLERFAGNRGCDVTTTDGATVFSHALPTDPRQQGADLQRVLWTRGAEAARSLFRRHGGPLAEHPLFLIYRGELDLWLGHYQEAAEIFRRVLDADRQIIWAWIGLGATAMLQGKLERAQEIWAEGLRAKSFIGPTLYVYRGECYRRQGDMQAALRDLQTAVEQKPQRLSAQINLALARGDAASLEDAMQRCRSAAPLLIEELHGPPAERLESVLQAMAGNRSSSPWFTSYSLWGRRWRAAGTVQ